MNDPPKLATAESPRLYFTLTAGQTFKRITRLRDAAFTYLSRRLKCLLLVKQCVVIPIVLIRNSKTLQDVLSKNSFLLTNRGVSIALRHSAGSVYQYVREDCDAGHGTLRDYAPIAFVDEATSEFAHFDPVFLAAQVKQVVDEDVAQQNGPLTRRLGERSKLVRDAFLSTEDMYLPHFSGKLKHELNTDLLEWVNGYYRLLAYSAAARSLGSECLIPEHNYYLLEKAPSQLSEYEIFTRLLWRAYESVTRYTVPTDLLDVLSFEDVEELRTRLKDASFYREYMDLQYQALDARPASWDEVLFEVNRITQIDERLNALFAESIRDELRSMRVGRVRRKQKEALGVAGQALLALIPGIGDLLTARDVAAGIIEFIGAAQEPEAAARTLGTAAGDHPRINTKLELLQSAIVKYVSKKLVL